MPAEANTVTTYAEAAEELGVYPMTIADVARLYGLTPKPVPRNGKAKGLDANDMQIIRGVLSPRRSRRPEPVPA